MVLDNKVYNVLKWVIAIFLPALGTLYFTLSDIWGLPHATEVLGTITCVTTFLGVVLGVSTYKYNTSNDRYDGVMNVLEGDTKTVYDLSLSSDVEALKNMKEVAFKVKRLGEDKNGQM